MWQWFGGPNVFVLKHSGEVRMQAMLDPRDGWSVWKFTPAIEHVARSPRLHAAMELAERYARAKV